MSNPNMEAKVKELMELKRMKEEIEAEIAAAEDEIKAVMGSEETLLAGAFKVSWKTFTSSRFDSTRFKKDHAELAAAYTKTTTARRFSIKKKRPNTYHSIRSSANPENTTNQGSKDILPQSLAPRNQKEQRAMDIYAEVTARIITEMEKGIIPWEKPWIARGGAISHATGKRYSLLNQMLLGRAGEYLTFKQVQQEGGRVRKGEKASMVVFWKFIEQEDEETHEKKQVPFLRYYNVFHIDQCEGLKAKHQPELPNTANADEAAESIIAAYIQKSGVRVIHERGDRAYYQPSTDRVVLPSIEQFAETAEYYSTAFHELTHSTGHASRLNRLEKTAFFGTEAYSKEELVAEIGAATLVNTAGLETASSFRNSAAYVQNWLKVLNSDKRFIVSAAGKAEKAVALILGE